MLAAIPAPSARESSSAGSGPHAVNAAATWDALTGPASAARTA